MKVFSWINRKVQYQIAAIVFVAVLLASLINFLNGLQATLSAIAESSEVNLINDVANGTEEVEAALLHAAQDLEFIQEVPPVQGILRAVENGGVDSIDGSSVQLWETRLEVIFRGLLNARPQYASASYTLANGTEVVHLDSKNGTIYSPDKSSLPNHLGEENFTETLLLQQGRFFASHIFLARDSKGEFELPYRPVIQYAVPVFDSRGEPGGVIAIELNASSIISRLEERSANGDGETLLIDSDGYYLSVSDENKKWGGEVGHEASFVKDHPAIAGAVISGEAGVLNEDGVLYAFGPVMPNSTDPDYFWVKIKRIPKDVVFASSTEYTVISVLLLLFTLIASVAGGMFMSKRMVVKPIHHLQESADRVAQGDLNVSILLDKQDEIGQLGDSFDQMVLNIKKASDDLHAEKNNVESRVVEAVRASEEQKKSLKSSVALMLSEIQKFADGDMTAHITEESNNKDIEQLYKGFNRAASRIREMLIQVTQAVSVTSDAAVQISSATEELAVGAQEQSAQTDEVAAAVEEMSKTIVDNAQNATETAKSSQESGQVAREGGEIVQKSVEKIREIARIVEQSAATIEQLGNSSQQIGEIIAVIDEIADQTNLLALNAAIEAARAGEQGRGFAVVADEVRKLAERTSGATTQIGQMIKTIQSETVLAVDAMRKGREEVAEGIQLADRAGEALTRVVSEMNGVVDRVNQIAAASEEQSATSTQIAQNVEAISTVINQSAKGVTDIAQVADHLNRSTEHLLSIVGQFHVETTAKPELA